MLTFHTMYIYLKHLKIKIIKEKYFLIKKAIKINLKTEKLFTILSLKCYFLLLPHFKFQLKTSFCGQLCKNSHFLNFYDTKNLTSTSTSYFP